MPINYERLRGNEAAVEVPADGNHQARLERAALVVTQNGGERLVTEWTDEVSHLAWTSWNRFDQTGLEYTRELLQGLGVNLQSVTDDDALTRELESAQGHVFDVRTSSQKGSQGDRWFTSTYVDGAAQGVQAPLGADVPADVSGLSPPPAVTEDDEIPF